MNAKKWLFQAILCLSVSATPALAAQAVREDHSGLVVWIFLGLCALIIIAQLVPALLLLAGMVKGLITFKDKSQGHSAK